MPDEKKEKCTEKQSISQLTIYIAKILLVYRNVNRLHHFKEKDRNNKSKEEKKY